MCSVLQRSAAQFNQKSRNGSITVPDRALLLQNYPNPFNGITTISYALPFDADVTLRIYTATGQLV